ncbi:MAG: hypothetical protein H0W83_11185 [Planctomycetes bacterium]|nr:hypothetical protein [Planctomycetota bacterium]
MNASVPLSLEPLIGYLSACGGCDRFEFHDEHGEPDPIQARSFAEAVRATLGANLGIIASVEQTANRVVVCVVTEPAPV